MRRYLVTGGAGFIGSHLVRHLIKKNNFVRVLDNFSSGKESNLSFTNGLMSSGTYELIRGDIRDKATCDKACQGIDYVLHQAALRSVPRSLLNPDGYNAVNIQGTLNMLEAALKNKVRCFVFASSSSIYGEALRFPQKEIDLPRLVSPYALSKLAGEYYCRIFSSHHGLNTVSLRYFNVFGPRQALDDEYAVVIPKFINCILKGEPLPIYGTGHQSRDFTYVDNVAQANLLAARFNRRANPDICPVFNVAGGKDFSILKLTGILNKITGKDARSLFLPPRPGDVFKTRADLTMSKKILGYWPKVDFLQGLRRTVEYFEESHKHA